MTRILLKDLPKLVDLLISQGHGNKEVNLNALTDTLKPSKHNTRTKKRNNKPKTKESLKDDEALEKLVNKKPLAIYSTNTDVPRIGEVTRIHFWNPHGDTFCKMFSPNGPGKPKNWKPIENKEQLQELKSNQHKKICEKCTDNMRRDLTKKQLNNYDLD
jgi:hypothetical protein